VSRSARRTTLIASALLAASAAACATPAAGQELVRPEDAVVALFSLQTELEVDAKVLRRMEQRLEENRKARLTASDRVNKLYSELDDLFEKYRAAIHSRPGRGGSSGQDREEEDGATVQQLEEQIEIAQTDVKAAERAEASVREEGHKMRDDIRDQKERMGLLAAQIDALYARLPAPRESLTGVWDITFLPSGDKGVFALFQSGTIVTGQYVLDGPFHGSLDGTLIDRKLLVHRIDSRLGRSMDLSASLSQDGQALRGTWENYDLSNGQARTGSWAGRRRPARRAPEAVGEGETPGREGTPP
jgi:hypothetical protein